MSRQSRCGRPEFDLNLCNMVAASEWNMGAMEVKSLVGLGLHLKWPSTCVMLWQAWSTT